MSSGQRFKNTQRHDPYRNFNFEVKFIGKTAIYNTGWNYISAIELAHGYTEYKEGGNNGVPDMIQGDSRYEPVEMHRGMSEDNSIIEAMTNQWDKDGLGITNSNRYEIIISVKDRDMKKVVKTIKLIGARITNLSITELMAQGDEVLMNNIIVAFDDVDIK